jgi:glycosyltransferase involved in cell wall biosynthesis
LKIAVDGYEAGARATGVGKSITSIVSRLGSRMPESGLYVLGREHIPGLTSPNIVQEVLSPDRGYFRWQNGPFRRRLKQVQPDILIASNYTLPVFCSWKSLLIVHDVSFASHPEWFSRRDAFKRRLLVQRSVRKSEWVVVVSATTKSELLRCFDVEARKVRVVYHGVEDSFQRRSASQIEEWKRARGLEGKRLIGYLGSIFNRRHIPVLVEAVARLRQKRPELMLHVVGKDLTHPPQRISRLLQKDWIRWEQGLADEEVCLFYSSLDAFAYISEYEGFGLPPMEALACGTVPVLLNKSSLSEVYTGMSVLVDEPDVDLVAEGLESVLTNDELGKDLVGTFRQRRAQFSWDAAAETFEGLIRQAGTSSHA